MPSLPILVLVLLISVILHELAHGMVAKWLGDPTADHAGRLTINPLSHIDLFGTVLLPLLLLLIRSPFVFGYAKPVPINPAYFDDPKKDMALVGLAGPGVNFLLAGASAFLFHTVGAVLNIPLLTQFLFSMVFVNVLLGTFNLMPIPPLDGSRLLIGILPNEYAASLIRLERYGFLLLLLAIFIGLFSFVFGLVRLILTLLGMPYL